MSININTMMESGIKGITKTLTRFYLKNPQGRRALSQMIPQVLAGSSRRKSYEKKGIHIPPFLIASIATQCNLHCAGCYARAGGNCGSGADKKDLSASQWKEIFQEAKDLGISFILLAGGEPFMRRDVVEVAAETKEIVFPIFTNGTMLDEESLLLLDKNRHLVPVLSIEGNAEETDSRRGEGTYDTVRGAMDAFHERGILFGTSITVTRENCGKVTSRSFISELRERGCGLIFFVEYVPIDRKTEDLVLTAEELRILEKNTKELKSRYEDMIVLSFPGDEEKMGGCLASGRGFFHISASGGAEPCPFSPYAKYNLQTSSILEVLQSGYFADLREIARNVGEHTGGCTLFKEEKKVLALMRE